MTQIMKGGESDGGHSHASTVQLRNYFPRSHVHRSKRTPYLLLTLLSRSCLHITLSYIPYREGMSTDQKAHSCPITSFYPFSWGYFPTYTCVELCSKSYIYHVWTQNKFRLQQQPLLKIWLIILIFLKPCLEDESIWCQGSSQTRNWTTDWLLVHLTIW